MTIHNALSMRSTVLVTILAVSVGVGVSASAVSTTSGSGDVGSWNPSVLPVAPGDVPTSCTDPGSSCGPDRYCSLDPSSSQSSDDDSNSYYCLHKSLSRNPISPRDVLALILVALCCFLAAMGGIGGGGLMFPLIVMVCNFTPKEAIVLSHAGVFGNCLGQATFYVGSAVVAFRKGRNVRQDATVGSDADAIDGHSARVGGSSSSTTLYQSVAAAVLVILPGLLAGGSAAITLQGLVPSTAILILALLTLTLGVVKTSIKARKMWKEEEDAALGQAEVMGAEESDGGDRDVCDIGRSDNEEGDDDDDDEGHAFDYKAMGSGLSDTDRPDETVASGVGGANACAVSNAGTDVSTRSQTSQTDNRNGFCERIFGCCCTVESLILSCWATDAATFLAQRRGSISKCSLAYFVVVFLPVLFGIFFVWRGRVLLMRRRRMERALCHESDGGIQPDADTWEENATENALRSRPKPFNVLVWWLPLVSFVVGLISALLGIGGGEILGPTLLILNMNPQHSSTTTSVLALLNSGTNTLHNATAGLIISPAYFSCIWSMGLVAGGAGRAFSMIVSEKSGKNSIIGFSLAVLLTFAAILVAAELLTTPPDWSNEGIC